MRLTSIIWIAVIATAVFAVLFATSLGVGVSPDSTAFLGLARYWLQKLHVSGISGPISRSAYFGPLYSLLLTLGSLMSRQDPRVVARWLDVVAFAVNLPLVGLLVHRAAPGVKSAPIVAAFVLLTSTSMLTIHTMAWTETVFFSLWIVNILVLDRYLARPSRMGLALIVVVSVACVLQRFAGVSCVAMTATALLLWKPGRRPARIAAAAGVGLAALMALRIWSVVSPDFRAFSVHVDALRRLSAARDVIPQWIVPASLQVSPVASAIVGGAIVLTAIVFIRAHGSIATRGDVNPRVMRLLAVFAACYVATLVLSLAVWDALIDMSVRILAPLEWTLLLAAVIALARARWGGRLAIALGIAWLGVRTVDAAAWIARTHQEGQWYSSRAWQESPTMQWTAALPSDVVVVTNGDDAVGAVIGRQAWRLPNLFNPGTLVASRSYSQDLAALRERLRARNGVIVLFDRLADRNYLPDETALSKSWTLLRIAQLPDGAIYRLRDD